jgi:hypothetical protein
MVGALINFFRNCVNVAIQTVNVPLSTISVEITKPNCCKDYAKSCTVPIAHSYNVMQCHSTTVYLDLASGLASSSPPGPFPAVQYSIPVFLHATLKTCWEEGLETRLYVAKNSSNNPILKLTIEHKNFSFDPLHRFMAIH